MSTETPHDYDELDPAAPPCPLSATYHAHSLLGVHRAAQLAAQIARYGSDTSDDDPGPIPKPYPTRPVVVLPPPRRRLWGARLDDVIAKRRSQRAAFTSGPVTLGEVGTLLGRALGTTAQHSASPADRARLRAYPSAGALHPIETYVFALRGEPARGAYHYDPTSHTLARIGEAPQAPTLREIVLGDALCDTAALAVVFTATWARTQVKYGERGYRFVMLEAGHAAQNVLLVATALGLGAVPIGGFLDDALAERLGLAGDAEQPIYVVLVGRG